MFEAVGVFPARELPTGKIRLYPAISRIPAFSVRAVLTVVLASNVFVPVPLKVRFR
jgi:hypothetical protein